MRFQTFVLNGYLAWMLECAQTNHGSSSACTQWFSCQNGGADIRDIIKYIMRISHALEGGNYKRESTTGLGEFGCCYYCCLGVLAQVLGSLLSHRPSTSAVSVPLE